MASIFDLFTDDFFKSILDEEVSPQGFRKGVHCPNCGLTYSQFRQGGKFGCSQCYEAFDAYLEPLIKRVQGSLAYEGRVPSRGSGVVHTKHHIKKLRQELQGAIAREDFERAMVLRDQIRQLEQSLEA